MREPTAPARCVAGARAEPAREPARDPLPATPAPFPRPVRSFVGRAAELLRAQGLIERSGVVLVYGVPGIGKSEFVYQLIDTLRTSAGWRRAQPTLVVAQTGQRIEHWVALLRFAVCGGVGTGALARGRRSPQTGGLGGDLAALATALERRPRLLFLDDVQYLDAAAVAEVLSYLARRVGTSRIFAASRVELLLPADMPPPTVVCLPPLSTDETGELARLLAESLDLDAPPVPEIVRQSSGSPHQIQRALLRSRGVPARAEDALVLTVRALSPQARRLLILCRVTAGRLGMLVGEAAEFAPARWELAQQFLIDALRWRVHDLVWDTVSDEITPAELQAAHRHAAELYLRRDALGLPQGAGTGAMESLATIQHLLAGGDAQAAWAAFERAYRSLAGTELDPLTLDVLAALREALPAQRLSIGLRTAQVLLRRGELAPAQEILDGLLATPAGRESGRLLRLLGEAALRDGQLELAAERLRGANAATARAADAAEQRRSALRFSSVLALQGQADAARQLLSAVATWPGATATEHARLQLARGICELLSGAPRAAARCAAREADPQSEPRLPAELEAAHAALETLSRCALDELPAARRALDVVLFQAAASGRVPVAVAELCRGVVLHREGTLAGARLALTRAHEQCGAQRDWVLLLWAELHLADCALAAGDASEAAQLLLQTAQRAARTGCRPLRQRAEAQRARALLESVRLDEAYALARALQAEPGSCPRVRLHAVQVLWRVHALRGDGDAAARILTGAEGAAGEAAEPALAMAYALEHAELCAQLGETEAALQKTEAPRRYFAERGLLHEVARTDLLRALAAVQQRSPQGSALASEALASALELSTSHGYGPLLLHAALVSAALLQARGDGRGAREQLGRGLAENPCAAGGLSGLPLRAALSADAAALPGVRALLVRLGLFERGATELHDRSGRRVLCAEALARELPRYELLVDLDRSEIRTQDEARRIPGRPLMCALLARLLSAGSDGIDAERLFYEVWGGRDYHPLKHRNTIYVALTRLRQALRELLPQHEVHEVIETAATGWRLAPGLTLGVLRRADAG